MARFLSPMVAISVATMMISTGSPTSAFRHPTPRLVRSTAGRCVPPRTNGIHPIAERAHGLVSPSVMTERTPLRIEYRGKPSGLFGSKSQGEDGEKKRPRIPNPVDAVRKFVTGMIEFRIKFAKGFAKLSKGAKVIVTVQLFAVALLFGSLGRSVIVSSSGGGRVKPVEVPYSTFMDLAERNGKGHKAGEHPALKLQHVIIGRDRLSFQIQQDQLLHESALKEKKLVSTDDVAVKTVKPTSAYAMKPSASPDLLEFLRDNKVPFRAASTKGNNLAANLSRTAIMGVYLAFMLRMYKSMSGKDGGSPGKFVNTNGNDPKIKFEDIEGIDNAKFEVMELVDTLRNPQKYAILGARAPKGLLLVGPPGTGKTMLARATAASAGVPLLYCSGSDFVEMFVGRGAARVRKTFARAGKVAPCIIFIDELDALGKSRDGNGFRQQSNDEAEQTLNQLLACMDGLDSTQGVCVLAATNRQEVLDTALTRPGRFDRIIQVELPDVKGRERILRVHASKLPGFQEMEGIDEKRLGSLGKGNKVDLSAVAVVTPGLAGAELDFIVNEAAIRAVRRVSSKLREGGDPSLIAPTVTAEDFEESVKNFFVTRKGKGKGVFETIFKG